MQAEKVIFREDIGEHYGRKYYYMIFPEDGDSVNGVLTNIPCYDGVGYYTINGFIVEASGTMSMEYYRNNTKPIPQDSELSNRLAKLLKNLFPEYKFELRSRLCQNKKR